MNAIHIYQNKFKKMWYGIAFFFAVFSVSLIWINLGNAVQTKAAETPEDGVYTIDGTLCAATSDKNSMGNDALNKPFTLIIKNGSATLRIEMIPLTAKSGSTSFKGYLAEFNYFPGWEGYSQPKGQEAVAATVESYYEGVYDAYNNKTTGLDANVKGKLYPHFMTMPVDIYDEEIWTQVYVPVMEAISAGSGSQYARLDLDWDSLTRTGDIQEDETEENTEAEDDTTEEESEENKTAETLDKTVLHTLLISASSLSGRENVYTTASLKKLKSAISTAEAVYEDSEATQSQINSQASLLSSAIINLKQLEESSSTSSSSSSSSKTSSGSSSTTSKKLNINSLSDGIYKLTGKMYKIDKSTLSMSNDAINHNIKLTVKNGKYYLTMDFDGMQINTQYGYLGRMKYFTTGYSTDKYGAPTGTLKSVTVNSYQKDSSGNRIKDSYGTNYPDKITFPMIPEAKKNGWVPLQVFVPIMDAISSGSGTQSVYLKLDLTSLSSATSSSFASSSSSKSSSSSSGSSGSSTTTSSSKGAFSDSTQTASALIAGSSLPGASETTATASGSSLPGTSQITDASGENSSNLSKTASTENDTKGTETNEESSEESSSSSIPAVMSLLAVLAGVLYKVSSRRRICFLFLIFLGAGALNHVGVYAASGNVYTCTINRSYSHPVTGVIEDSGGSSSTTTGQGMVEGCVGTSGILEVTDSGEYYLTFRLGLADYTSKHEFSVQSMGDSSFSSVDYEQTGTGSDDSGTTVDYRIKVPSQSCIVRCAMYVDPMGRDVIFYMYPSDYTVGNNTDMKATVVTEDSTASNSATEDSTGSTQANVSGSDSASQSAQATTQDVSQSTAATEDGETSSEDDSLNESQGLSLSTAENDSSDSDEVSDSSNQVSSITLILCAAAAFTVSGLILILVTAWIVYYFRRNWKRWGGGNVPESEKDVEEDIFSDRDSEQEKMMTFTHRKV